MKKTKQILAMILAVMLIAALSVSAFADVPTSGTITVTNATKDKEYSVYKIFNATVDGNGKIAYTYDGTLGSNDYFVQDEAGNISAKEAAVDASGNLTSEAITYLGTIKPDNAAATKKATADGNLVFDGLEFGYYYITSSLGAAVTVDSTNPNASVIDKNQTSTLDKNIINGSDKTKVSNVNVGDIINFQVDLNAPNYKGAEYVTNYYVYDNMDEALTFNGDIKVFVNDTELAATAFSVATADEKGNAYTFVINIPWTHVTKEEAPAEYDFLYTGTNNKIKITYSATVNEKIEIGTPMENKATHDSVSKPTKTIPETKVIEPAGTNPWFTTESYASEISIKKIDGTTKQPLTGAKFSIAGTSSKIVIVNETIFRVATDAEKANAEIVKYYRLKDGSYTKDAPIKETYKDNDGKDVLPNIDKYDGETLYVKVEVISQENRETPVAAEGWVNENGILTFTGLGEGTYTVTELVAPNGYNLLNDAQNVIIKFDSTEKVFTATLNNNTEGVTIDNGVISFTIANNAGTELPSTGGIGTTIFYIAGAVLAVGAAIILFAKKRVNED